MTYTITYTPTAAKTLKKLDRQIARQIITAIEALQSNPYPQGAIQLKGGAGELRIRTRNYRIIYEVEHGELVILVLKVGHRREIYR